VVNVYRFGVAYVGAVFLEGTTPMQCPPTSPGLKGRKFHLVPAASNTAWVSMPMRLNIFASSFTKAMLMSRCEFSIT